MAATASKINRFDSEKGKESLYSK